MLLTNWLSRGTGWLAHCRLPAPLQQATIAWFVRTYRLNMAEAEQPAAAYASIGDLFTRRLRPGCRPIGHGVISPVDGRLTEVGSLIPNTLLQAKGVPYTLERLCADNETAQRFYNGTYLTFYLCPTDYHRVHVPIDGVIRHAWHIPGALWPVNEWGVKTIPNLFARNERVVTLIEHNQRQVAVIMVGATNVGRIRMAYDASLVTNQRGNRQPQTRRYEPPLVVCKGDELGVFEMGSTVIVLFQEAAIRLTNPTPGSPIRMGHSLGTLVEA